MTPQEKQQRKRDAKLLSEAARITGNDPNVIRLENPFTKSGGVAKSIQMGVAHLDPVRAAQWRLEADGALSVATLTELDEIANPDELSYQARQDLWDHDPHYVREFQQQKEQSFADQLKALETGAEEKRLQQMMKHKTNGDERQARKIMAAEDEEQAARQAQRQGVFN